MQARKLVIGPPGTGKTTYCLNAVENALGIGIPPQRIAFLSFTRQAASEAVQRALKRFDFKEKQFCYFRTLHSLAWRLNGMQWEQAFKDSDWRKFGAIMDIEFRTVLQKGRRADAMLELDDCQTEGDHLARIEQFARVCGLTLEQSYHRFCETDMTWLRLEQYSIAFASYKRQRGIYDYIDIINMCNELLDVDVAIFDEAQDMTPQQFRMAERITKNVPSVIYAGDDMQAIFAWAGADVDHFVQLSDNKVVLPKSYRLPKVVWDVAHELENRVRRDYKREWTFNDTKQGAVKRVDSLHSLPLQEGEWLLIGRNWKLLEDQYVQFLKLRGYPYYFGNENSLESPEVLAVLDYEALRNGRPVSKDAAMRIFKFMSRQEMPDAKKDTYTLEELGLDKAKNWMAALDNITEYDREYIRALLRAGFKLRDKPRIRVDTIHGTKGTECDNVVMLTDIPGRSWRAYEKDPAAEVRLFYTGVTRAKQNLYIVDPQTPMHFPL